LPYEEWGIEFSEITVGIRVGVGKCSFMFSNLCYILDTLHHLNSLKGRCIMRSIEKIIINLKL
jgi:hypothetical protein